METKHTYTGQNFIFHLKENGDNLNISLSSHYVQPPITRNELKELAKFIDSFIVDDKIQVNE